MGLDAFVACTCDREGRTSEPPIPLDQIVMNEGGQKLKWGPTDYSEP